jgi:hypothetical protein
MHRQYSYAGRWQSRIPMSGMPIVCARGGTGVVERAS